MKRLAIVVEGQTELNFVNQLLQPHLSNLHITPINLRGGITVNKIQRDVKNLIRQFDFVTTLVDFYGFHRRGQKSIDDLQTEIKNGFGNTFIPYIQKYEFEALIFSDLSVLNRRFGKQTVCKIHNPEDINHDKPPSKIISDQHNRYNKHLDGPKILKEIGLIKIRENCPRFNGWVSELEKLR